jgi:hypothetical protein
MTLIERLGEAAVAASSAVAVGSTLKALVINPNPGRKGRGAQNRKCSRNS